MRRVWPAGTSCRWPRRAAWVRRVCDNVRSGGLAMMSTATCVWTGDRVASLARAALEAEAGSPLAADVRAGVHEVIRTVQDQQCDLLLSDLEGQFLRRADQPPAGPQLGRPGEPGPMQELLKQRASFELKLQKERESHKSIGDQTLSQTEQITALQGEVERLKKLSETTLRDRNVKVEVAKAEAAVAESQTADAAFVALWKQLSREMPEVFTETHVPTQKTFEQLCESYVEFVRTLAIIEAHVHQMLRDLRQVGDPTDRLSTFYVMFLVYDSTRWMILHGRRAAVELLALRPDSQVLEIGCGTGLNFRRLLEKLDPARGVLTGLDFSA